MDIQEIIVVFIFIAVVAYFVHRIFFKKSSGSCNNCEYNKESN